MQIKSLMLVAGTSLCVAASAYAQNPEQRELLADASARTSFQGGGTYGADGFNIMDASGNNRLTIGGALQFRYNASFRDNAPANEDTAVGFGTPLTRVRFSGTVGDKALGYKVQLTAGEDGTFALDDVYASWDFGNGFKVMWGQMNAPVLREVVVGAENKLGSDFSVGAQTFGQGYSQGIAFSYSAEKFRVMGALSDGAQSANTDFFGGDDIEADYSISLRAEGLLIGTDWAQFNNYTSWRSASGDALLLGGAVHWQDGGSTGNTVDQSLLLYTIDASWEGAGYNISAMGYGSRTEPAAGTEFDDFGVTLQGGLFLTDQFELFARYDGIFFDEDRGLVEENQNFLGAGANYYVFADSNAAKFTAQLNWALDPTSGAPVQIRDSGLLGSADDNEIALQLQFQLVF